MSLRPLLLGHRGSRALKSIPENTLASFDQALADGCDGFEFDVRLTADGAAVVCHDSQSRGVEIARATAQQLTSLPRLLEILGRYQGSAFLDIELKVSGLEKTVIELLHQHTLRRGFVISSFLPDVLRTVHAQDDTIPLGLICETKAQLGCWQKLPIEYVIPHRKLAGKRFVREIKSAGRKILVWTVNNAQGMLRFSEWGVDGIISDDTQLLVKTFASNLYP